ncbi:MAG: hypothetical protein M3Q54_02010 [Actinomycetota bacterium]|nr:hypothetical protein [Actinomycetota bacterium]
MVNFDKQPVEFYGEAVADKTARSVRSLMESERCPFLDKRCVKQRKSDPTQTIGSCTVGYQGGPLIICPHRFLERHQIFLDCVPLLAPNLRYLIVPEVAMPGGSVDYFVVAVDDSNEVLDYVGLEIQSLDTTGSGGIWKARQDLLRGELKPSYPYGINWRMSAKTILVQMHHKAAAFEALGKRLILVVQDKFLAYIAREFQTDRLQVARDEDPVRFHVYDAVLLGSQLRVVLSDQKSTDMLGVERMLSSGQDPEVLEEEVVARVKAKMPRAIELQIPPN